MTYLFAKLASAMFVFAFISSFLRIDFAIAVCCCAVILGIGYLFFSKKSLSLICFASAAGSALVIISLLSGFYPAKGLDGMSANITGKVTEISASGGNPIYTVKTESIDINGAPQKIKIRVSGWDENSAGPFDIISCPVVFTVYSDEETDSLLADRSEKISVYAYTKAPFEIIGRDESSAEYIFYRVREKISSVIYEYFIGWHAPFAEQIMIGTRGELESEITSAFRKSGMSHILAISGMHMVIVIGLFEKIVGYGKSRGKIRLIKTIVLIAVIIAYMITGGLGASVLRSGFMLITHYLAKAVFRGSKSLDNLGMAVMVVLFANPMTCCDIGFILSVTSCAAICSFAPQTDNFICEKLKIGENNRILHFISEAFSVTLAASLAVLPISAAVFGGFSLFSVFSNLLAAPFIHTSLVLCFFTVFLGLIPFLGFFSGGTAFIAMIFNSVIYRIAGYFASVDFAYIETSGMWISVWMFGSAIIILAPIILCKNFRYLLCSFACSAAVLAICAATSFICGYNVAEIEVTAFEHGTAISCSRNRNSVLIVRSLEPGDLFELNFEGAGYDTVISLGASSGAAELELVSVSKPEKAYLSFEDAAERYEKASLCDRGSVPLWEGAFAEILSDGVFCANFGEASLLYISEECDIMDIAPEFRRADIIVLDGVSPADFPSLRCEYMILRRMEGFYSGTSELITLKNGSTVFFAYDGNIVKGRFVR